MSTLSIGDQPHELTVIIPFQAKFDATFDVTFIDEDPPTWAQVTLRLEVDDLTIESTLIDESGSTATFAMTLTEAQTDLPWKSRLARLELVTATNADPILIATGTCEVVR